MEQTMRQAIHDFITPSPKPNHPNHSCAALAPADGGPNRRAVMNMMVSAAAMAAAVKTTTTEPETHLAEIAQPERSESFNPAFIQLEDELDRAIEQRWNCHDAASSAQLAYKKWKRKFPAPEPVWDESLGDYQPGHGKRCNDHLMREQAVMIKLRLAELKHAYNVADVQFTKAVVNIAMIKATNDEELLFKAEIAFLRDLTGTLAKSVAADLLRIRAPDKIFYI
jgi:hypothetical protein